MSTKKKSTAPRVALGIFALAALLFWFDPGSVISALRGIRCVDIVILLALSVVLIFISVVKWRGFLRRLGINATLPHLFRLYLVGYFVNLFMPSSIGGDVVRSLYVGVNVDRVRAVSATLLERYTGFMAMILMALAAVWIAPNCTPEIRFLTIGMGIIALLGTMVLLSKKLLALSTLLRLPRSIREKLERLQDGIRWGLSDGRLLFNAAILSLAFHLFTIVNTAAVGYAIGWSAIPWSDLLVVVPLILLVGAIPISPQGLGIQEGAFLFFLHSVGASTGQALAIALVLRAKSYILACIGGYLWWRLSRCQLSQGGANS